MTQDPRVTAVQRLLLRVAFVGCVLALLLVAFVAKFEFLQTPSVLDQAQIARNLAEGRGLTHSVVRPLGMALAGDQADRVTFSAPLYPVILSLPVRLLGANGHAVALTSLAFAALTLVLMYVLCMRYLGERIAVAGVGVVVLTVPFVMHAVSGTEVPCLAFLVTGLFGLLLAWRESSEQQSHWWPVAASVIVAMCWLVRYEMVVLIPCVAAFWLLADPARFWRRLLWLTLPFVIIALPWVIRNSLLLHRPIVSASSYMLLSSTTVYPQDGVLRAYEDVPRHPWTLVTKHPGMILVKAERHAMQSYMSLPLLGNPYITALFLFGILLATVRRRLAALHWCLLLAIVLTAGVMSFYVQTAGLLIAFTPMVAILALVCLTDTLENLTWPPPDEQEDGAPFALRARMWFQMIQEGGPDKLITIVLVVLVLIVSLPMTDYLFVQPATKASPVVDGMRALEDRPYRVIMSDVPSAVAWYSGKRALLLPSDRWDLAAIEEAGVKPDAIYLSATPRAQRAIFPGFKRVEDWNHPGVLLERLPGESRPVGVRPDERLPGESRPARVPPDESPPVPVTPASGD